MENTSSKDEKNRLGNCHTCVWKDDLIYFCVGPQQVRTHLSRNRNLKNKRAVTTV